jgi:hypothetical protein
MRPVPALAIMLGLVACNAILGIDEPEHRHDAGAGTGGGTSGTGASAGTGGVGGGGGTAGSGAVAGTGGVAGTGAMGGTGGGAGTCASSTANSAVIADSVVFPPGDAGCPGANNFGGLGFANVGYGRGLLKFQLTSEQAAAIEAGKVQSMTLVLTRNVTCESDSSAGCPAETATIEAYPLVTDWDEGTQAAYTGADWCRKSVNPPLSWKGGGADGEYGALAGSAEVDKASATAAIPLDPMGWQNGRLSSTYVLSVLLKAADPGRFVFATKESIKYSIPSLQVTICQ